MIRTDFIALHHILPQIKENHVRHYYEMNVPDDYGQPDVDWELYGNASQMGRACAAALFDDDKLIGYIAFSLGYNQRYRTRLEANSEAIFIEKPYRAEWSDALLDKAISCLRMLGAQEINFTLNDETVGRWLEKRGAKQTYKVWSI